MRLSSLTAIAATVLLTLGAVPTTAATPRSEALIVLADVVHNRDAAVVARFNPQMRAGLSAAKLRTDWSLYQIAFGRYVSHGTPTVVRVGAVTVIRIPLRMSHRRGEFRLTFNGGKIAGLYLLRTGVPL
jgi:hypothetical protein